MAGTTLLGAIDSGGGVTNELGAALSAGPATLPGLRLFFLNVRFILAIVVGESTIGFGGLGKEITTFLGGDLG
jgi:hypothetical protein